MLKCKKWLYSGYTFPKTDVRYWYQRVYHPRSVRADRVIENPNFYVHLQHGGQRRHVALATASRREAAEAARQRYLFLIANGWDAFDAKYRPTGTSADRTNSPAASDAGIQIRTVGEYLEAVRQHSELSGKTIEPYAKALRLLVSEIFHIRANKQRFDYRKGGHKKWIQKIEAVALEGLTPEKVRAWKKKRLASASTDELARRRALISANSTLRLARSLFSRRTVLSKLETVQLPDVLPFDGVSVERTTSKFHGCGVEPRELMRAAITELSPEPLKTFLLCLSLGLRRAEADWLEWSSFDFETGTLTVRPTQWYALKTHESAASLPVEPEILPLFRGWKMKARSRFVLESDRQPKAVTYQWYRCQETFDDLLCWLRGKGVQGNKPLHALRKLYGSLLTNLHGIHAASSALRHTDIRTTSEHYADRTVKLTPGLGSVLSGARVIAFPKNRQAKKKQKSA